MDGLRFLQNKSFLHMIQRSILQYIVTIDVVNQLHEAKMQTHYIILISQPLEVSITALESLHFKFHLIQFPLMMQPPLVQTSDNLNICSRLEHERLSLQTKLSTSSDFKVMIGSTHN
jgi:hypothetical protein